MERRFRRQLENKNKKAKKRLLTAGLVSLFVHGAAPIAIESDKIMDRVRIELRTDDVAQLVKDINSNLEQGQGIQDMDGFLLQTEYLEHGFTKEELAAAQQELNRIIIQAQELKARGKSKQEIADYLLSEQGEYNKHQNSLIELLNKPIVDPEEIDQDDTGLEKDYRSGDCQARWKLLTAAWSEVFPEDSDDIKTQVFDGADVDGDGQLDNQGHVRVAIELDNGQQLIVEGRESFTEASNGLNLDTSQFLAQGYLADHGLYEYGQGSMRGAATKKLHGSVFVFPSSGVAYSAWENPDEQPSPFFSNPDQNNYIVEYIPSNTLTLEDLQSDKMTELSDFTDIDPEVIKALAQNDDSIPLKLRRKIIEKFHFDNSFESIAYLSSPEIAKDLIKIKDLHRFTFEGILSDQALEIISQKELISMFFNYPITPAQAQILNNAKVKNIGFSGEQDPEAIRALSLEKISLYGIGFSQDYSQAHSWPMFTADMARALSDHPRNSVYLGGYQIEDGSISILSQANSIKNISIGAYITPHDDLARELSLGSFEKISFKKLNTAPDAYWISQGNVSNFYFEEITREDYDLLVKAGKNVGAGEIIESIKDKKL